MLPQQRLGTWDDTQISEADKLGCDLGSAICCYLTLGNTTQAL